MEPPRRSERLKAQEQKQDEKPPPKNRPRDPAYDAGEVPAPAGTWAHGTTVPGGTRFRAKYTNADAEETVAFEFWDGKEWKPKEPTHQPAETGYARFQFRCKTHREEERRARVFAHLVHGPPPGDPEEFEADHTSKLPDGTWAKCTGPVVWLTKVEHGKKHGAEGAAEARKRKQAAEAAARKR